MGVVRVKTTNDRLLEIDYSDTEAVKKIISSWGMVEKLAEGGDTVASAILVDLQTAIGVSITEFGENKKVGFDVSKMKEAADNGKLDEFVNKNLSEKATKQLKDVLSNKEACEKLLNSPQAKELMKKLKEGK